MHLNYLIISKIAWWRKQWLRTSRIIGYYMEATPADRSTYLDDVSGDANAGYVTISRFVEDYRKVLEAMREKRKSADTIHASGD